MVYILFLKIAFDLFIFVCSIVYCIERVFPVHIYEMSQCRSHFESQLVDRTTRTRQQHNRQSINATSTNNNMIKGTFVVVLSILLLIISVSGFFVLLIGNSNDCNIFYPTFAQSAFHSSHSHHHQHSEQQSNEISSLSASNDSSFFYTSTLCQLTLILAEVLISLVIIFNNEIGCNHDHSVRFNSRSINNEYNLVPSTSKGATSTNVKYTHANGDKCRFIFSLKLIFIFLVSISFLLRLVTSTWSSILSLAAANHAHLSNPTSISSSTSFVAKVIDTVITGASNFSGIIYVTSIIEVLLFVFVLSSSTQRTCTSSASFPLHQPYR